MALPLIPLAVGAGILALLALTGSSSSAGTVASSTPGAPPMPVQLKQMFDDLLANGQNADGLIQVAGEMEKYGYVNEGAALRAKAAKLKGAAATAPVPLPASPAASAAAQQPLAAPSPVPTAAPVAVPTAVAIPVIPPPPPTAPAAAPTPAPTAALAQARVTTNDPPPSGDLIMRDAPSDSGNQVPGGGAEKDGIVQIVNANASPDGIWSEIIWPGGSRRPAAQGFAKKQFLVAIPPSPTTSGIVVGAVGQRFARCVAPSGCRLRIAPSVLSDFRCIVANNETVQVLNHAQGSKADSNSPGPGGWAQVLYKGKFSGWLPSEWLSAA